MLNELTHYYLQQMGIQAWVVREASSDNYPKQAIYSKGNVSVDVILIEDSDNGVNDQHKSMLFSGKRGVLLSKMLASIGLNEQTIYVTSPSLLLETLKTVTAKAVLIFGEIPSQSLLNTSSSLDNLRQTIHHYEGIPCLVTYHPDTLLKHPLCKKNAWQDLLVLQNIL